MKLKIIFLFIVLAVVDAEVEECGDEKAAKCVLKLLSLGLREPSKEEVCEYLSEARDCMNKAAEECTEGKRNEDIDEGRRYIRSLISKNCPETELEIPVDIEQCINSLEDEEMECVSDGVAEVLENMMKLPDAAELDEDEIKCSIYQFVAKCVVQKVEDSCGEEASQLALVEMFDAPEEIQESCRKADIKGTLKRLTYNIVKRRK